MNDEEKLMAFETVNACRTLKELSEVILALVDDDGNIHGRTRRFPAINMADNCINFENLPMEVLTREFGIRQQAMMIQYYLER